MSKLIIFLVLFALLFGSMTVALNPVSVFGQDSCATLPLTKANRLANPCTGIVDYSYYLRQGTTNADLTKRVNILLNSTLVSSVNMACQQHLVRYACSQVYLKCKPGLDFSNASTYNTGVYAALAVPFLRPCKEICTEFPGNCTTGGKLISLPLVPAAPACSATIKRAYVSSLGQVLTFHSNNDKNFCFSPKTPSLSGAVETYDRSDPNAECSAFVDKFYVPQGNKINSTFTPLLPPKAAQKAINIAIHKAFQSLKPYLDPDCVLALKKRVCYSSFLTPNIVPMIDALKAGGTLPSVLAAMSNNPNLSPILQGTITLPSYPAYHYCTDYLKKCANLIAKAPSLNVNCNSTLVNTDGTVYRAYPEHGKQLLATLGRAISLPNPSPTMSPSAVPSVSLNPTTAPTSTVLPLSFAMYSNTTTAPYFDTNSYSYQAKCPLGYSVPADPNSEYVQWVSGTGCAVNCLPPLWTPDEWDKLNNTATSAPVIGFIFSCFLIAFLVGTKEVFNSYPLMIYAIFALIASVQSIYVNTTGATIEDRVCVDETIYISSKQGTHSPCVQQGATLTYTFQGAVASLSMLGLLYAMRISHLDKAVEVARSRWFQVIVILAILVLPAITTGIASKKEVFGYTKGRGLCFLLSGPYAQKDVDLSVVGLPVFYFSCFGGLSIIIGLILHFTINVNTKQNGTSETPPNAVEKRESEEAVQDAKNNAQQEYTMAPLDGTGDVALFCWAIVIFFSGAFIVPFLARVGVQFRLGDEFLGAFKTWTQCVFSNYDGVNESSWSSKCGSHVSRRPTYGGERYNMIILTAHALFVCPVFVISYMVVYHFRGPKSLSSASHPHVPVATVEIPEHDPEVPADSAMIKASNNGEDIQL